VKCVVWDLDETLWEGTLMELDGVPEPLPSALELARSLKTRGVLNCVATRNPPSLTALLSEQAWFDELFVDAEVGWAPKDASIRRLAERLDLSLDTFAYVDEDPFERAAVASAVPEVTTFSLASLRAALDGSAPAVTEEASRRTELYRERRARARAEEGFGGSREEFMRGCELRLTLAAAGPEEAERLAELMERTRQYNSSGAEWPLEEVRARIGDRGWLVATVRLTDRYGDYGLVGAAFADRSSWTVHSLTVSCRVAGRGALEGLVAWLASEAGTDALSIPVVPTERNVPLRLGLRALGLSRSRETFYVEDAPSVPDWLTVTAG
jgi:methoxymalonate biosynthesis protein